MTAVRKGSLAPGRRLIFRVILLSPAVFLGLLVVATLARLLELRWTDAREAVDERAPGLLGPLRPPTEATMEGGVPGLRREGQWTPIDRQGARTLVHVLGGSSVVLPSEAEAFPGCLQVALGPSAVRVVNLGQVGMTSAAIAVRGVSALELAHPDVVVFYEGHNDTTLAYGLTLQEELAFFRGSVVLKYAAAPWLVGSLALQWGNVGWALTGWSRALELDIEPAVMAVLAREGLLPTDNGAVGSAAQLARTLLVRSLGELIDRARAQKATVVLVTPISNLEFAPVGLDREAREVFASGLATHERAPRLSLLRRARDLDVFNGSIRAKSDLVEAIRALDDGRTVHVLDLERALEADPTFGFGWGDFADSVHLKPATHARVATLLQAFLQERGLLAANGAPSAPGGDASVPSASEPSKD